MKTRSHSVEAKNFVRFLFFISWLLNVNNNRITETPVLFPSQPSFLAPLCAKYFKVKIKEQDVREMFMSRRRNEIEFTINKVSKFTVCILSCSISARRLCSDYKQNSMKFFWHKFLINLFLFHSRPSSALFRKFSAGLQGNKQLHWNLTICKYSNFRPNMHWIETLLREKLVSSIEQQVKQ